MASLTYDEAKARVGVVRDLSYELDFDLTGTESFRTTTVVRFGVDEPGVETFLELRPTRLISATLNGEPIDGYADGRLPLTGLAAQNEVTVLAEYAYSHVGEGLHRFVDPADGAAYVYAQPSIAEAPQFMACFDQPDLKAPVTIRVTADPAWVVRSNATGVQSEPGRWEFEPTKPVATYLITIIAGPYAEVRDEHDGFPLALYARKSYAEALAENATELFELTKQCLDRYHELFGIRMPFGKYEQAFVPEFTWGAMEFPGLVVFRDEYIYRGPVTDTERARRASIVAHEMAHMWFGDLVTMRWWDDTWLNESFATYMGYRVAAEATRYTDSWADFASERKIWGYGADQRPSTHPVAPVFVADTESAFANFDGISYAKGCAALRQLVAWLGDDAFFTGLRAHFDKHAWGNATLDDLLASLSAASGRDLSGWADKWLRSPQVNTLRPVVSEGSFAVAQTAPEAYPTVRPHRIGISWTSPSSGLRERLETDVDGPLTEIPALRGVAMEDVLLNDRDLTFAKVRFTPDTDLARLLTRLDSPLDRAVVWGAVWDAVRDGEIPAMTFVDLVRTSLAGETHVGVVEHMLGFARGIAVNRFLPVAAQAAGHEAVNDACEAILAQAAPGGSLQLAAFRTLISGIPTAEPIRAWLAGQDLPEGLIVDDEVRWTLLLRLAVLGDLGEAELDAEQARDGSARGAVEAARCRAARPDAAAKAAAFEQLVRDRELSNRMLEAIGQGFWRAEHAELTDAYVERYFAELPASQEWRSGYLLAHLGTAGYPVTAAYASTVEAAERMLAQPGLNTQFARAIADSTDDLRRAVRQRNLP
ncbi:MAG: aminopeptidase N [Hamadaea sp.]|uniref:aminopeptidase N n=1 Tax=Hamadaea sp. TaxID=2024425 RepID=UPI001858549C|nr:aminopeptidase N [Hamadaea sp.]NUR72114.1 aminopeptidase N [Hamadaea sp.]NUT22806.1 aminopeptidase N [Hamadaea sp.]